MSLPAPWSGSFGHQDTSVITGLPLPGLLKNAFREKRWCYAGIVSPELFFGAAVVHLGYVTSTFCFGFDRTEGKMVEHDYVRPPLGQVRYDLNPETGTCWFKTSGNRVELSGDSGNKNLAVNVGSGSNALTADVDISAGQTGFAPMHFPMDMGEGKTAFTAKAAGMTAGGSVQIGDKEIILHPENSFALFDWTHGAYHRQTFWNWTCGAGQAREKTDNGTTAKIGFNFSRGVYENGTLENTLWIDGQPEPVDEMTYDYDAKNPLEPWDIASKDEKIRLKFFPEGMRQANDNFIILASKFIQPCGRFEGEVTTRSGKTFVLENTGGVVEEHYAKW